MFWVFAWPAFESIRYAFKQAHNFHITEDEALHIELIENLVRRGKYQAWRGDPFAPHLTTGPTVIVPAAILASLSGWSTSFSGRIVVIIYHLFLLVVLICGAFRIIYVTEDGKSKFGSLNVGSAIVVAGIFVGIFHLGWRGFNEANYFLFGVLGEGVSAFYLVLGLFSFRYNKPFLTGMSATLAFLSKPYLFIFSFFICCAWFLRNRFNQENIKDLLFLAFGCVFPWIIWLGWMTYEMGVQGTIDYWIAYPEIMKSTNGAGLTKFTTFSEYISLIIEHILAIWKLIKVRTLVLVIVGTCISFIMWKRKTSNERGWGLISTFIIIHFLWWLFLTPGVQTRYLFPVVVCALTALVWGLFYLIKKIKFWPRFSNVGLVLFVLFGCLIVVFQTQDAWYKDRQEWWNCGMCRQEKLQEYWRRLSLNNKLLWSTSGGYASDLDILLTAPFLVKKSINNVGILNGKSERDLIVVGEFPKDGIRKALVEKNCKKVFVVPQRSEGFWRCN